LQTATLAKFNEPLKMVAAKNWPEEKIFSFCQILFKYPTFVKKIKR